jgi:hypothetical protein
MPELQKAGRGEDQYYRVALERVPVFRAAGTAHGRDHGGPQEDETEQDPHFSSPEVAECAMGGEEEKNEIDPGVAD